MAPSTATEEEEDEDEQPHEYTRIRSTTCPAVSTSIVSSVGKSIVGSPKRRSVVGAYESFLDLAELIGVQEDDMLDFAGSDEERTSLVTPSPSGIKHEKGKGATIPQAYFLLLKSFIGGAVLALPSAYYNGGLLASSIIILVTSAWNFYCMYLLYIAGHKNDVYTLGDLASLVSRPLVVACEVSLVLVQCSFCVTYFIFFSDCFTTAVKWLLWCTETNFTFWCYAGLAAVFIPAVMIRKLDKLAVLALLADALLVACLLYLMYVYGHEVKTSGVGRSVPWWTGAAVGTTVGTSIFAFEGIGMVLPVAGCMEEPCGFPKVLRYVGSTLCVTYMSVGAMGCLAYGEDTATTALLNLSVSEPDSVLPVVVQLAWCASLLVTFPIQLSPALTAFDRVFSLSHTVSSISRAATVLALALLSYIFRNSFSSFISISGVFCCLPLAFIYPPLIHLQTAATTRKERVVDMSLMTLGGIVFLYVAVSTFTSSPSADPDIPCNRGS